MSFSYRFPIKLAAMVSVITLGLHLIADHWYLYWLLPWFDILMHSLGGVFLGFFVYGWLGSRSAMFRSLVLFEKFITVFLVVLIMAILWEGLEFFLDLRFALSLQPSWRDTLADLFFGTAGALLASLVSALYVAKVNQI